MQNWHLTTWQKKSLVQQVQYPSDHARDAIISKIQKLPPLVTPLEVQALKTNLAKVARGEAFLLQGGDCAETFSDCNETTILNKIRILLQISFVLIHGLEKPVVRVGRIAGQYAKPRSYDEETINDITLPTYRGDLINSSEFTESARIPDPNRMLEGYHCAGLTLNYIRALVSGGFADLFHPEYWNLEFAKKSSMEFEYHKMINGIHDALMFIKTIGNVSETLKRVDFYTSHEALHLYYEQALTRKHSDGKWYNLGTHFPWIGMRTATIDSSHIEYARGIANPIAIKIGPSMTKQWLITLLEILNPRNEAGKITLIHRFGAQHISEKLPPLINAVKASGMSVVWSCDPMHGNTSVTKEGYKTRSFDVVLQELEQAVRIHQQLGSYLGGVHFELTGEDVTECVGGARGLTEDDLKLAYKTLVDPRLNYEQSLEMAMCLVNINKKASVYSK